MTIIQHPNDVPIQVWTCESTQSSQSTQHRQRSGDGLSFYMDSPIPEGITLHIRIDLEGRSFDAEGVVSSVRPHSSGYHVVIHLNSEEMNYQIRMAEQMCYIVHYRNEALAHGREISHDEAAVEWIFKYAAKFPKFEMA